MDRFKKQRYINMSSKELETNYNKILAVLKKLDGIIDIDSV